MRPSFNGVPYTTETSYSVPSRATVQSVRPTICMQLISRSNLFGKGFKVISSMDDFYNYFPDDDPHLSLEKARILMNSGYNLYAQNVYNSESPSNIRILNDEDNNEILSVPFSSLNDSENSDGGIYNLTNYEDCVIKLDLSKVQAKDYLIVEINNKDVGVQVNLLIWFHEEDEENITGYIDPLTGIGGEYYFIQNYLGLSLQYIYFYSNTGVNLKKDDIGHRVSEIIRKCSIGFYSFYGDVTTTFYVVHNNGFLNIGNHSENVSITMEKSYIPRVISRLKSSLKVAEFQTRYNTDNNEIILNVESLDPYIYKVGVSRVYGGKTMTTETFICSTDKDTAYQNNLPFIEDAFQSCTLVSCSTYKDSFSLPTGITYLQKLNNTDDDLYKDIIKKQEVSLFVRGLSQLSKDDTESFDFYYDSNFNSLTYQKYLYELFKDSDTFGFFVFRGLDVGTNIKNIAYFTDQEVEMNDIIFHTCDLCLSMLSTSTLVAGKIDGAKNCSNTRFNYSKVNFLHPDIVVTRRSLRGFDENGNIKDMRYCMIKPVFLKLLGSSWDFSISSVTSAIDSTKKVFSENFNTFISMEMSGYKQIVEGHDVGCEVQVSYRVAGITDIDNLNIQLVVNN